MAGWLVELFVSVCAGSLFHAVASLFHCDVTPVRRLCVEYKLQKLLQNAAAPS